MSRSRTAAGQATLGSVASALLLALGVSGRSLRQAPVCADQGYSCRIRDCCEGFQCVTMDTGLGLTDYCQPATGPKLICFRGECKEPYYCPPMGAPGHDHSLHHSPFCVYSKAGSVSTTDLLPQFAQEIPLVADPNAQTTFSSSATSTATASSSGNGTTTSTDVTTSGPGASGEATASTTEPGGSDGVSDGVTEKTKCVNGKCVTTVTTCVDGVCATEEKPAAGASEAPTDGGSTAQPPADAPPAGQGTSTTGEASGNATASATATNGTTTSTTTCDGTGCNTETTSDTPDSPDFPDAPTTTSAPNSNSTSDQASDRGATVGTTPPTSRAGGLLPPGTAAAAAGIAAALAFVL